MKSVSESDIAAIAEYLTGMWSLRTGSRGTTQCSGGRQNRGDDAGGSVSSPRNGSTLVIGAPPTTGSGCIVLLRVNWKTAPVGYSEPPQNRPPWASGIDRAIHSSGLLGRHVGERSGDELGWFGRLALALKARSDAKTRQPGLSGGGIDDEIGRLEILVDETTLM
jgi:hypothetical protein